MLLQVLDDVWRQVEGLCLFGAMIFLPLTLVFLLLSAAIAPSHFDRLWVFVVAVAVSVLGGLMMGVGFGLGNGWTQGVVAAALFYGLPVAMSAMGLVYNGAIGIPAHRRAAHTARLDRIDALLETRGYLEIGALADALGLDWESITALAVEVRRTGRHQLELDLFRGWVWSQPWADRQCEALRLALDERGRVEVDRFAAERGVSSAMVREWVYTLVYRGAIAGYVSWKEGVIYVADAAALRASSRCPACAGQLELVGRGVIQCQHCDAQSFAPTVS